MRYLNIGSPVEDNELIQGCLRDDRKYQEALFQRYAGKLMVVSLRYARHRMEAEDLLQDAFIRIFDHIDQFQGKGSFEGWMRRIVVNTALKNIDKKVFRAKLLASKIHQKIFQVLCLLSSLNFRKKNFYRLFNNYPMVTELFSICMPLKVIAMLKFQLF